MAYEFDPVTIDYSAYPTAEQVVQGLVGGGYWPDDADQRAAGVVQATAARAAAIREFEERTGWYPFLADAEAADEERFFDATDGFGYLDLGAGLLELASAGVQGRDFVVGSDLWLRPSNAPAQRRPYSQIQFVNSVQGGAPFPQPNVIRITGLWGRVREVPPDVWYAVLRYAMVMTMTGSNQEQDVVSWSEDGFSEELDQVGVIDPKTVLNYLPREFQAAVRRWARVVC